MIVQEYLLLMGEFVNKLLLTFLLCLCTTTVFAQWNPLNYYDSCQCVVPYSDSVGVANDTADRYIRVCINVYMNADGTSGYDYDSALVVGDSLSVYMHSLFHLIPDILYNPIWDDSMMTTGSYGNGQNRSAAYGAIRPDSALQIYLGRGSNGGTYANSVDALTYMGGVKLHKTSVEPYALLHETGHIFDLLHTHERRGEPCDSGVEIVNSSGSARLLTGDFDSLTPPDAIDADSNGWCDVPDSCASGDSCYTTTPHNNLMSYHLPVGQDSALSKLEVTSRQRNVAWCALVRYLSACIGQWSDLN